MKLKITLNHSIQNSFLNEIQIKYINEIFSHFFNKVALHVAIENGYPRVVQLLLTRGDLNVNIPSIKTKKLMSFKMKIFFIKFEFHI